jgi:hypothetical protein
MAAALVNSGARRVLIIGPAPRWKDDLPKLVVRRFWDEKPERTTFGIDQKFVRENENLKRLIIQSPKIRYLDLIDFFCDARGCLTRIGEQFGFNLTTWDRGHLTDIASDYLANKLIVPAIIQ